MFATRNPAVVALLIVLASCASAPPAGDGIETDPVVQESVATVGRAVAGQDIVVVVHAGHAVRAELRPDGSVHVWRGLLLRTRDANELAFALAHELAHERLRHPFPSRDAARDVAQEVAADGRARGDMRSAGLDAAAGRRLLVALREEARIAAPRSGALAELDRRIAAFPSAGESAGGRARDAWRPVWRERWRGWLAVDPAAADPLRRTLIERRASEPEGAR